MKLRNGYNIPTIGFGTWQISDDVVEQCVLDAINCGYRHIDTAVAYGNEKGVGRALSKCHLKREELFITSKIPAEVKNYQEAKKVIEESLNRLNIDYLDLMLIHAPRPWSEMGGAFTNHYYKENIEVWNALVDAYNEGLIKTIGVSNFSIDDLENIINSSSVVPFVNQICVNPSNTNFELINYCKSKGILVEAYSPIGTGRLLKNDKLIEIAKKYNVSVAQLCIKYCMNLDLVVLPKSVHKEYIESNFQQEFSISSSDMEYLKGFQYE